jgi:hypothetical protein
MLVEIRNLTTGEVTYSSEEDPDIPETGSWCFTWADGEQRWLKEGKLHRLEGPAAIYASGTEHWYVEGKRHRLGGPAITYANGSQEWYVEGTKVDPPC